MKDFMNYDFNITNIGIAIYIRPGEGTRTHKNRALHGIAINTSPSIDDVKKYTFPITNPFLLDKMRLFICQKVQAIRSLQKIRETAMQ